MSKRADVVVRAMTAEGSFRVIAVNLESATDAIAVAQRATDETALHLAELVAAAILVREISAPDKRVQLTLREADGGSLVAESRPDGACRGFVNPGNQEPREGQRLFQAAYHRRDGSLHQSTIEVSPQATIAEALMTYLQTSAQVIATVDLRASHHEGKVEAVGFAAQLLPDAEAHVVELVTTRLESGSPLVGRPTASEIIAEVVGDLPTTPLARSELRFECTCSQERVMSTLAGLPSADLVEMITDNEPVSIHCDGCGRAYEVSVAELAAMLDSGQHN